EETYRKIWEENRKLVRYLRQADAPIPEALALVARHVLEQEALAAIGTLRDAGPLPPAAVEPVHEAQALGLSLDLAPAKPIWRQVLTRGLSSLADDPTPERVGAATRLIEDATALGVRFGLWQTQNRFFEIWRARPDARATLVPLGVRLGFK